MTLPLALYRVASRLAGGPLRLLLAVRARRGKEDPARLSERRGLGQAPRPAGPVLWLHGASVGETQALLALMAALKERRPDLGGVLTTGTVTAGRLVEGRLPEGFVHRYAPLDVWPWVARFLDRWRPDLSVRIDSEIWPATLTLLARRRVPVVMVNARLSARSLGGWQRLPATARRVFGMLTAVAAQDEASASRFAALGVVPARLVHGGALKAAAEPPSADPAALAVLRAGLAGRPVWLAASTHPPEEAMALGAHKAVAGGYPGLLTLIAPRHPDRGPEIAAAATALGLRVARRGAGEPVGNAEVFVADTLGEMGLWYRLAPFAFIGGSVAPLGGHNPYEPAALGVALAAGPDTANFGEAYAALDRAGAVARINDAASLAAALTAALAPDGQLTAAGHAAALAGQGALAVDPAPLVRAVELVLAHLPQAPG